MWKRFGFYGVYLLPISANFGNFGIQSLSSILKYWFKIIQASSHKRIIQTFPTNNFCKPPNTKQISSWKSKNTWPKYLNHQQAFKWLNLWDQPSRHKFIQFPTPQTNHSKFITGNTLFTSYNVKYIRHNTVIPFCITVEFQNNKATKYCLHY